LILTIRNGIIIPNNIIKNSNNSSINSNNQQKPISQSNINDEYNKKNRITITPKSSLISQKLKNMKHNSSKYNSNNNNNGYNNNFLFGTPLSPQSENNSTKENNGQFSFFNTTSPLSINVFNNNNSNKFKNALSASLSPPVEIKSSLLPNTPALSFSSSLPTSFTFHSPYVSNNNPFSNISNNNNSGFSFNYTPNTFINNSNKIIESDEENSDKSINTSYNNLQNQDNTSNTSLNSNGKYNENTFFNKQQFPLLMIFIFFFFLQIQTINPTVIKLMKMTMILMPKEKRIHC